MVGKGFVVRVERGGHVELGVELVDADAWRHVRGRQDTCEVDPHQLETADLTVAGCDEQRPDGGLVGKRARVDHDTRAGRGELEEPVRPPLGLGEDPGAHTAPLPGEPDDPEREDLDVRRAADDREPRADFPAGRLDDREVALAVDDRVAPVPEQLVCRPDRRAEVDTRLVIDELGRTLGILVAGRPQAEAFRGAHGVPIADINKTGLPPAAPGPPLELWHGTRPDRQRPAPLRAMDLTQTACKPG